MDWNPRISTMQEEYYEDIDVENAILALREEANGNQQDLDSRSYQRDFTRSHPGNFSRTYQKPEERAEDRSFYLRTTICLLIFCGFLWLRKENRSVLGMAPEVLQEVLSQSVVLQDLPESVKMEKATP